MVILRIIITCIIFFIITCLMGKCVRLIVKDRKSGIIYTFVIGFIAQLSIFEIIVIVLELKNAKLTTLCVVVGIISLLMAIVAVVENRHVIKRINSVKIQLTKEKVILYVLIIAGIAVVTAIATMLDVGDYYDDTYFTGWTAEVFSNNILLPNVEYYSGRDLANAAFSTGRIFSPWYVYVAALAKISGINYLTMTYRVMPILLIPTVFAVYYLMGKKLFNNETNSVLLFIVFLSITILFDQSYWQGTWTNVIIHPNYGNSVLAAIGIPLTWHFSIAAMDMQEDKNPNWIYLSLVIISSAMMSGMAMILIPVLLGSIVIYYTIRDKTIKYIKNAMIMCCPLVVASLAIVLKSKGWL